MHTSSYINVYVCTYVAMHVLEHKMSFEGLSTCIKDYTTKIFANWGES